MKFFSSSYHETESRSENLTELLKEAALMRGSRKRVNSEEDEWVRRKRNLNHGGLKKLSKVLSQPVQLDDQGVGHIKSAPFMVVLELPQHNPSTFYFHTMVASVTSSNAIKYALAQNHELVMKGMTLALCNETEVHLYYSITSTSACLSTSLQQFMDTATALHVQLQRL